MLKLFEIEKKKTTKKQQKKKNEEEEKEKEIPYRNIPEPYASAD